MITERDIGKKCRLIRTGEIGRQNLEDKGAKRLSHIYKIISVDTDEDDTYVEMNVISPASDECTSFFEWRLELCDEELEILT